ncbi:MULTISPECIES: STAS domain-containing protein [Streptomyces]|uniref:STAS domain-containing protein n=1 Tax=Streptomyces TaxID=1883 RepID=UPI0019065E38|nr:STAS domain-containing protein [Streptomyces sp. NE5-10]GHJ92859.1 anti-sigma factor antagonist [Streptomyces sp. NE5-10]
MDRQHIGSAQPARLRVEATTVDEGAELLVPVGELDHHTAEILREPLDAALDAGRVRLVVDCAGLGFCDSTGLNVLLGARLRAEAAGGAVHLVAMRPAVARVFRITGAEAVFTVHDTLATALPGSG